MFHADEWYVYIVECCAKDHLYVGMSKRPIGKRIKLHCRTAWEYYHTGTTKGRGSQFVKVHGFKSSMLYRTYDTKWEALAAEDQLTLDLQKAGFIVSGGRWARYQLHSECGTRDF